VILGLDTATAGTAAAVWAPDGPAVERRDDPPAGQRPAHAGRLLVLVEEALVAARAGWEQIERIAVGVGPGGFTGLRLGIATARGLAQANDIPLIGVSSLRALAVAAADDRARAAEDPAGAADGVDVAGRHWPVVAVIDARRGEVFALAEGRFGPLAIAPQALANKLQPGMLAVGDGAVRFRAELERAGVVVPVDSSPLHRVSALQICRLGAAGEAADRDALLPDYRREPDATPRTLQ
jgi:tRNA threonylcarbamoyladenosine biosynthesis protein TsaB